MTSDKSGAHRREQPIWPYRAALPLLLVLLMADHHWPSSWLEVAMWAALTPLILWDAYWALRDLWRT